MDQAGPSSQQHQDAAVTKWVMWIIAATLFVCSAFVIIFWGVDAMPYDWIGVAGAVILAGIAIAFTRIAHLEDDPHAAPPTADA